ncbi:ComF family protein [Thioalkalivibrio sp. ALJ7]|uniref:ComF family protein n=1 Tax=Thioalkalivibrio sp. ALJ7 TaxID=1158756 RepID=UPI0035106F70
MQKAKHSIMARDPSSNPFFMPAAGLRWPARAVAWTEWLGEVLYPTHCGLCLAPGQAICAGCRADLPPLEHPCPTCALPLPIAGVCPSCVRKTPVLDALHAGWVYAWPLDQLILAYKNGANARAERILAALAEQMAQRLVQQGHGLPDLVLPVPLHSKRLRERGFNQADYLARQVAACMEVPLEARGLRRIRATDSQQTLGRKARRNNVKGAFAWEGDDLAGRHVLVVDDVATTGATLSALSGVLRRAGAVRVEGLVLARA